MKPHYRNYAISYYDSEDYSEVKSQLKATGLIKKFPGSKKGKVVYFWSSWDQERGSVMEFDIIKGATEDEKALLDALVDKLQAKQEKIIEQKQEKREAEIKAFAQKYPAETSTNEFRPRVGWTSDDEYLNQHSEIFDINENYNKAINAKTGLN